jgi:chromatin structure-remodeling complex subunit RSC9
MGAAVLHAPTFVALLLIYTQPVRDPDSMMLTALLIIRLIYRISTAATDTVPRADEDHFGFPGVQEEIEELTDGNIDAEIEEGERRGRMAIARCRSLMEHIRMRDKHLQDWITEMINFSLT